MEKSSVALPLRSTTSTARRTRPSLRKVTRWKPLARRAYRVPVIARTVVVWP
jgi:hypothetical protein